MCDLVTPYEFLLCYRKFAELKEKELGPDHLIVAKALNNLAVMYSMQVVFLVYVAYSLHLASIENLKDKFLL